jgi:hypothetical protein
MKVRLKSNWMKLDKHKHQLTLSKIYYVIGIEANSYRIINDNEEPILYPPIIFDIIDKTEPEEWITEYGNDGERYSYPKELNRVGFFEEYFDDDEKTIKIFKDYLNLLKGE